jgi:sec-independent protein translocase protein TatB
MPDIGWMELLVIGIVALIVVGPKELPMMFRKVGQFTGRVRAMAKDFQRAMDEAADETGMTELNRDLRKATQYASNPKKAGMSALKDTFGDDFDLDPEKYAEGSETRRMAEEKAAATKQMRDEVEARRQAQIEKTIADKQAAASAGKVGAAGPADPSATSTAPDADIEPARTGTSQS